MPFVTPDDRYIVVRGRLWRRSDPHLDPAKRLRLVAKLMKARRAVAMAQKGQDGPGLKRARAAVQRAKVALGERGPVWWSDGEPDLTRHLAKNTS